MRNRTPPFMKKCPVIVMLAFGLLVAGAQEWDAAPVPAAPSFEDEDVAPPPPGEFDGQTTPREEDVPVPPPDDTSVVPAGDDMSARANDEFDEQTTPGEEVVPVPPPDDTLVVPAGDDMSAQASDEPNASEQSTPVDSPPAAGNDSGSRFPWWMYIAAAVLAGLLAVVLHHRRSPAPVIITKPIDNRCPRCGWKFDEGQKVCQNCHTRF